MFYNDRIKMVTYLAQPFSYLYKTDVHHLRQDDGGSSREAYSIQLLCKTSVASYCFIRGKSVHRRRSTVIALPG